MTVARDRRPKINGAEKVSQLEGSAPMKGYAKMTRGELLQWIGKLESRQAARAHARQEKATVALADSEARLRAILATAVEGIVTINDRGIIESFNLAAETMFGYLAAEVVGKNISVLMPEPHHGEHAGYLANYQHTGHARIIGIGREVTGRRKNGVIFPMDLSVSEVKLAGRRIFTGFIRDITERKRLEREILEISEREQRRIGHDLHDGLCQQLAGIELMSQVLQQKLAGRSTEGAERAGEIARNVRESIAHTRSLARGLSPVTLEAEGLMSALRELAANTEKMFRVTCRFECERMVSIRDHATATHLFRIAQEAISNAIRHGKTTRRITINLQDENDCLRLAVSDDGVGFQIPATTHKNGSMGLRIMQSRTGMMGGNLAISGNPTGGATVTISVPRSAPAPQKPHGRKK